MTAPLPFDNLLIRLGASEQQESIIRAMFSHRDEDDLTYRKIGDYCTPKLTESQVKNSLYDFRRIFQERERKVRAAVQMAGRLGKKGRKLIG